MLSFFNSKSYSNSSQISVHYCNIVSTFSKWVFSIFSFTSSNYFLNVYKYIWFSFEGFFYFSNLLRRPSNYFLSASTIYNGLCKFFVGFLSLIEKDRSDNSNSSYFLSFTGSKSNSSYSSSRSSNSSYP